MVFSLNLDAQTLFDSKGWTPLDGEVKAIYDDGDGVYIGGNFTQIGLNNQRAALSNSVSGAHFGENLLVDNNVWASISDGNGGWYIGGDFLSINGTPRTRIAHILPNGELDPNWTASANAAVRTFEIHNNILYVGGEFTEVNGQNRGRLAALSTSDGSLISNFSINTDNHVFTMKVHDNNLYIGGNFFNVNQGGPNSQRLKIAIIELGSGTATLGTQHGFLTGALGSGTVYSIDVNNDYIYVGGSFSAPAFPGGGADFRNLFRWNRSGDVVDNTFKPRPNNTVFVVKANGANCWLGGNFNTVGVANDFRDRIAYVSTTGAAFPFRCDANGTVRDIELGPAGTMFVAGQFTQIGAGNQFQPNQSVIGSRIIKMNATTGVIDTNFDHSEQNSNVFTASLSNGILLFGGQFTNSHIYKRERIARFNTSDLSLDTNWEVEEFGLNTTNIIESIDGDDNNIYVGGEFSISSNLFRLVKIDKATATIDNNFNPNPNNTVFQVLVNDDHIYAAGSFSGLASINIGLLVKLRTSDGTLYPNWNVQITSSSSSAINFVFGIALNDDKTKLAIAGSFNRFNGATVQNAVMLNLNNDGTYTKDPFNFTLNSQVFSTTFAGNELYFGGFFNSAQGTPINCITKYTINNNTVTHNNSWNPNIAVGAEVRKIAVYDNDIYLAGGFTEVSGTPVAKIAKINRTTAALDVNFMPQLRPFPQLAVYDVKTFSNRLYVGGSFQSLDFNSKYQRFYAYELPCYTSSIVSQPQNLTACESSNASLEAIITGVGPFSYQWRKNGTDIPGANSRVLKFENISSADAGNYDVVMAGNCDTLTSNSASITVNPLQANITSISSDVSTCIGDSVSLEITTSGSAATTQWYFNGDSLVGANANTLNLGTLSANQIGEYYAEVAGSNGCLASSDTVQVSGEGAIRHYPLNDLTGEEVLVGANANLVGAGTNNLILRANRFGVNNSAIYMTNPNGVVMDIDDIALENVTVSMWVNRVLKSGSFTTLLASDNNGADVHLLIRNSDDRLGMFIAGNFIEANTNGTITANSSIFQTWQHLVWTANGTNNKIYLDGVEILNINNGIDVSQNPISRIGNNSTITVGQGFQGLIDDVKIFSQELSIEEIKLVKGFLPINNANINAACSGGDYELKAILEDVPANVNYQWFKNGEAINGQTDTTYVIQNADTTFNGTYYLEASLSGCSKVRSETFNINIGAFEPVVITTQPQSLSVCEGSDFSLNVQATGEITGYNWFRDGFNYNVGANGNELNFNNITTNLSGTYTVSVNSPCGNVSSDGAVLNVTPNTLQVTTQPSSVAVCGNDPVVLTADFNESNLDVQWFFNGDSISGANSNSYTINNVDSSAFGSYFITATNNVGCSVTSNQANISTGSLAHYYPLNNGNGDDAYGNNNANITNFNPTTDRFNNPNGALNSTSSNGAVIDIADVSSSSLTVSMWIRRSSVSGTYTTILDSDVPGNVHLIIRNSDNRIGVFASNFIASTGPQGIIAANNTWRHVVWTASGTNNKIFVDGVEVLNISNGIDPSFSPVSRFGNASNTGVNQGFIGAIDDVKILTIEVGQSDIELLKGFNDQTNIVTFTCLGAPLEITPTLAGNNLTGLSYQWFKDGVAISGANSLSYIVPNVVASDAGEYQLQVDLGCVSIISETFDIHLNSLNNSPIHYYPFTNGSVDDIAGTNNITNTGFTATSDRFGVANKAMRSTGENGNVLNISDVSAPELTVSMWVRRSSAPSGYTTLMASDNTSGQVHLLIDNATNRIGFFTSNFVAGTGPNAVIGLDNVWRHIVWTASGSNNKVFVDGVEVINVSNGVNPITFPVSRFGNNSVININQGLVGDMDEIKILDVFADQALVDLLAGFNNVNNEVTLNCVGETLALDLELANNSSSNQYQWYKDGNPIAGATSSVYTVASPTAADEGEYQLEGREGCASIFSEVIEVTIGTSTAPVVQAISPGDTICEGTAFTLQSLLAGFIDSYQWLKDGNPIAGANSSDFSISNPSVSDAGDYSLVVENTCGTDTSLVSTIAIIGQASIINQPSSGTLCLGQNTVLNVEVVGVDLTYQWLKDGNQITGATTDSLVITNATNADAGSYTVEINSACGAAIVSNAATLVVGEAPSVDTQLSGGNFCEGDNVTLSASFTNNPSNYEWFKNGVALQTTTAASLTLNSVDVSNTGTYFLVASNTCGTDTTLTVNINVNPTFDITLSETICFGDSFVFNGTSYNQTGVYPATFTTVNSCDSVVTLNLTVLPEITNTVQESICDGSTFTFGSQTLSSAGTFTEVFTTSNGCDSTVTLTLTINEIPSVATQISGGSFCEGENVTLTASFNNNPTNYEWFKGGVALQTTTSASLTLNSVDASDAGNYFLVGSNACGNDTTDAVQVLVNPTFDITLNETICFGDSFVFNGTSYSQTGIYSANLTTVDGCDSIVNLDLVVIPEIINNIQATICDGDTYTLGTQSLNSTGIYNEVFSAANGCDSTVTLNLTVIDASTVFTVSEEICAGESFTFGTQVLSSSGTYTETFVSTIGCDSVVELSLVVSAPIDLTVTISNNDTVVTANQAGASYQWIDCATNQEVLGATNQSFTPQVAGEYAVEITVNGCTEVSACYFVEATDVSVPFSFQREIKLYPNPTRNYSVIENIPNGTLLQIFDLLGRNVLSIEAVNENYILNVDDFSEGVYIINFINNNEIISVKKLVVNK